MNISQVTNILGKLQGLVSVLALILKHVFIGA